MGIDFTGGTFSFVLLLFAAGLLCIIKGGDFFVDAATWIAEASRIPKFIIGATVVSFATTLPEMMVSVFAAYEGNADIAVGNAVATRHGQHRTYHVPVARVSRVHDAAPPVRGQGLSAARLGRGAVRLHAGRPALNHRERCDPAVFRRLHGGQPHFRKARARRGKQ